MNATCTICSNPCFIECGKCFVVISYFGEKHDCPDDDEGFYDMYEGSLLLCQECVDFEEDHRKTEQKKNENN